MEPSPERANERIELPGDIPTDVPRDAQPPPAYSPVAEELTAESGSLQADGRIDINLESKVARTLAKIIDLQQEDIHNPPPDYTDGIPTKQISCDFNLNIVIQIVGSRGDVQPFIALGTALKKDGHRVRIATHDIFASFVHEAGLEFYPIGGDPAELMAYMVKNPGLIPQMKTLRDGEIRKKQLMMATILDGCWASCINDDPFTQKPFVADAIIANPPSFAHIHCAQALSIPVHLMFSMPWSSTRAFPHPLANLNPSSMDPRTANWVSYGVVEWLTWQGLGDVINRWRVSIDLEPIPATQGPSLAEALKVPSTYCWSPALMPRPQDWPSHIDVCGFFFREPPSYSTPPELQAFLDSGPPPIYIGFGSIVVEDPQKLIDTVLLAVETVGIRAIISKGWSGIVGNVDKNVYYVDDCPHEWLFQHVAAVVHHGGAGTTACGLRHGRPTAIVPFFGDQPFWGHMVARAGAGPRPIPYSFLTSERLATAIRFCQRPEAIAAARNIAQQIQTEQGVAWAVESFYRHLPSDKMCCNVLPDQAAVWIYRKNNKSLKLSKAVVQTLIEHQRIDARRIRCHEINPIFIENRRWDPLTGIISASATLGSGMLMSTGEMLYNPYKEFKRGRSSSPLPVGSLRTRSVPQSSLAQEHDTTRTLEDHANSAGSSTIPRPDNPDATLKSISTAGNMFAATMKGFGKFTATYFKGVVVDIPHAAAEGFRQVPRLYGEEPQDYGTVHDWKSGAIVGGRNFVDGMTDGFTGFITQPVQGAKEEGALGAAKGFMRGTLGLATKVPSAGIGLVAYPFHGIAKSIATLVLSKSREHIISARLRDGYYHTQTMNMIGEQRDRIVEIFEEQLRLVDNP